MNPSLISSSPNPRTLSRLAGALTLVLLVCGPLALVVAPEAVRVAGDPAATLQNLAGREGLFRLGLFAGLLVLLAEVVLSPVLYVLFKPAGATLALVMLSSRLAMTVIQGVNLIPGLAALEIARGAVPGGADAGALAYLLLQAQGYGVIAWQSVFALHAILLAVLIYRSGLFPRWVGVLFAVAGVAYGVDALGNLLAPAHAGVYEVIVTVGALAGEFPFLFWLLKGPRIKER